MRVLNASLFLGAALVLFRLTRRAFGAFASFAGLTVLLFLPTLFFWSISLLKESFYFVLTVAVFAAAAELLAAVSWRRRAAAIALLIVALYGLRDLRNGAVSLALSGIALGIAASVVFARRTRVAVAGAAVAAALLAIIIVPPLQRRAVEAVEGAATASAGHVFTVGHGYNLLDEGFYVHPTASRIFTLTPDEAGRYVLRAFATYFLTPLPWQIETRGELTYLPEQLFWYMLVVLASIGVAAAASRDRIVTSLLIAYVLPTAAIVALTTGNVGTLIRHRTLVVPYVVWLSAIGLTVAIRWASAPREAAR